MKTLQLTGTQLPTTPCFSDLSFFLPRAPLCAQHQPNASATARAARSLTTRRALVALTAAAEGRGITAAVLPRVTSTWLPQQQVNCISGASPTTTNLLSHYSWLGFRSRLIHSRMYGEQLTSRTPSVSHLFRNRTASTSTSVTSSSCTTTLGPLASSCLATSGRSSARTRPISLTVVRRLRTIFSIFKVTSETSRLNAMSGPFVTACKVGRLGAG